MVTINGKYSNKQIKKAYKDKQQSLIVKIDDIKNNGVELISEASDSENDKESIALANQEISKMNNWEVKKQRYWNWSQSKILNISLVGDTDTLTTIKTILDKSGHTLANELILTSKLQSEIKKLETKLSNKSDQEQKAIITEYINQSLKQSGETRSIEEVLKEEYSAVPDYIKYPIQDQLEEVQTKSVETITSKMINGLINGTEVKAAMPAWMFSLTALTGFISAFARISFLFVLRFCTSNYWRCATIGWGIIEGGNTVDDIRRKIYN